MQETENHPLEPFLPANAKLLMLGSFPPPKAKWKMDFYYPNFQNDMWRIFGSVFFNDSEYFLSEDKKTFDRQKLMDFLTQKGIALSDTAREIIRLKGNASDNFLLITKTIDLADVLRQIPYCEAIVTTGEKATETLLSLFPETTPSPKIGTFVEVSHFGKIYRFYRMPSSSRAYPKPLKEKTTIYRALFEELGLVTSPRQPLPR